MAYFKGTYQECESYNLEVCKGEHYKGTTSKWANIIEVNESFYILINPNYDSDLEKVNELPINLN